MIIMDKSKFLDVILSYLSQKAVLSDLEKDLLSTINKYLENPFDRKGAVNKVKENNNRYPDVFLSVSSLPNIEVKPFDEVSDAEIHNNLYLQIQALWLKLNKERIIDDQGY